MNKFFSLIKEKENFVLLLLLIEILILLFSLFIEDFNFLKILIFINLIFSVIIFLNFLKIKQKPKEEKSSLFFNFLQKFLDTFQQGIVIYTENFQIVFVNKFFCDLVGLNKDDLINLTIKSEMINNEKFQTLANIFFPFLQGENLKIINKEPETIEVKFAKPKERYFVITYSEILIDKKYKLRIILEKTQEIEEAQKKLEFLQLTSHNLLTPLSEIKWFLEAIDVNNVSQENKNFIENALTIVNSAIFFSESILTIIDLELNQFKLNIKEVNLEKIFIKLLNIFKLNIEEKKIKVNIEIDENYNLIYTDENLFKYLMFIIIENAILYNKENGLINIKIQNVPNKPYLQITVEDTGIGMTENDIKNLFKKYFRSEEAKSLNIKGFGLGLYNASRILNILKGEITIQSQKNKGTNVTIKLPLDLRNFI
jgi:PAS domain S-box-containing protein